MGNLRIYELLLSNPRILSTREIETLSLCLVANPLNTFYIPGWWNTIIAPKASELFFEFVIVVFYCPLYKPFTKKGLCCHSPDSFWLSINGFIYSFTIHLLNESAVQIKPLLLRFQFICEQILFQTPKCKSSPLYDIYCETLHIHTFIQQSGRGNIWN